MDVDKPLMSRIKLRQQELTDNILDNLFETGQVTSDTAASLDSRKLSLGTRKCMSPDSRRSTLCLVPETPSPVFNRMPQKKSSEAHNSRHSVSTSESLSSANSDIIDSSLQIASGSGSAEYSTSLFYKKPHVNTTQPHAKQRSPNKVVLNKTSINTSINSHPATSTAFPSRSNRNSIIKQTKPARTTSPEKYFLKPKSPVNGIFALTPPSPKLLLSPKKQMSSCLFANFDESLTNSRESCAHNSSSTASMLHHSPGQSRKQKSHGQFAHSKRSSVLKPDELVLHGQTNTSRADALNRLKLARQKRNLTSDHSDHSTIPAPVVSSGKDKQQRRKYSNNYISSDEDDDMSLQSFLDVTTNRKNKNVDNADGLLPNAAASINRRLSDNFIQMPSLGTNNECRISEKLNSSTLSHHPGPSKSKHHGHNGLVKADHRFTMPRMRVSYSTPDISVLDAQETQGAFADPSSHHTPGPYLNLSPNHLMDDILGSSISPGTDSAAHHSRQSSSRNTSRSDSLYPYLSDSKRDRGDQRNHKHDKSNDSVIVVDLCSPDVATQKAVKRGKMPVRTMKDYASSSTSSTSSPPHRHPQQQQPMTSLTSSMGGRQSKATSRSAADLSIHALSHESGMHTNSSSHKRRHAGDSDASSRATPMTKRRKSSPGAASSALNNTMDAAALVGQLESDEAMAKRLQEELDREFAMALSNESSGNHAHHSAAGSPSPLHHGDPFHTPEFPHSAEFYTPELHRHRGFHTPELHRTRSGTRRTRISPQRRQRTQDCDDRFRRDDRFLPEHMPQHFYGDVSTLPQATVGPDPWTLMHNHLEMLLNSQDTSPPRRQRARRGQARSPRHRRGMVNPHVAFFDIGSPFGDGNDYESLMNLAESLGDVKPKGLSKQQINCLPIKRYVKPEGASGDDGAESCDPCLICICDFENGDNLRILTCFHEFHATCIDKWLKSNGTCPVCRVEVRLT